MFTSKAKKTLSIGGIVLLCIFSFYIIRLFTLRDFARQSQSQILAQLSEARVALLSLNASEAETSLVAVNTELVDLEKELKRFGVLGAVSFWDRVTDTLRGMPGLIEDLIGISGTAIHINDDLRFLKEHGPRLFLSGPGDELLSRLSLLENKLTTLSAFIEKPEIQALPDPTIQNEIRGLRVALEKAKSFIANIGLFIGSPETRHLLVLFQNESELRPGGGFLGSYAHLAIKNGAVQMIDVRDIYDPDGQLDIKMTPPEPLQRITKDWEARDANWFFDYPTSANQVISFLNQSKIYSEQNIVFSGAVAINTKVLGDLLTLIGPIELPQYDAELTSDSFLRILQREVESGENKKKNQPKKIVQELVPLVLERIQTQSADIYQSLFERMNYHLARKNILFFSTELPLQRNFIDVGISGSITKTPLTTSTIGDYLAVVSANIAGGKTDYVTTQDVQLSGTINASGTLTHTLTITRTHNGANETDWWYRTPHKTYTQVYLPLGSRVTEATGSVLIPQDAKASDYRGYQRDPLVTQIESTKRLFPEQGLERFTAFNKAVFAGWFTTPPGETKTMTLTYKHPKRFDEKNMQYLFVFDKQSGAHTSLRFSVEAPPGFIWRETGTSMLAKEYADPLGREIIRATLVPAPTTPTPSD